MKSVCLLLLAGLSVACAKVYFEEKFDDTWTSRWVVSDWKKSEGTAGQWNHTAGQFYADVNDKGIQTYPDAKFFGISAKLPEELDNTDKTLVFQFQVKHEQKIDCGGGYMKLLSGDVDQSTFSGETEYSVMFGPDICGYATKKVHTIFNYNGNNLLLKNDVPCETDQLSHVYTLILKPDNTFAIKVDNVEKKTGSLYENWDFLAPETIPDPEAKKPADWVDQEMIDDPEDKKPEGYDDVPAEIVDPEAVKPEDWNDEEDGEWEAPTIPNPEFKGKWRPKKIKNPAYKGKWVAPTIPNPDYVHDPKVYLRKPITAIGIELWQVKAGTIFDNVLLTDDVDYASKFADETWGAMKDAEKTMFEEEKKKEEAELGSDEDEDEDMDVEEPEDYEDEEEEEEEGEESEEGHDEL